MIIFDMNQVAVANLMQQLSSKTQTVPGEDGLRHMILNTIRFNRAKFGDVGDVILAVDCRKSWRKKAFRYYKADRDSVRKTLAPGLDWSDFFNFLNKLIQEIKDNFPYYVISVEGAEGDDIIGECVRFYHENRMMEEIIIISGDKDFAQLHFDGRVKQYSPVQKKFVSVPDHQIALREHIVCGDRGDGIPNILSPDNSLYDKIKQKKITAGRLELYSNMSADEIEDEATRRNFYRNTALIDLRATPAPIKQAIRDQLLEQQSKPKNHGKIFPYLIKHRLANLQENIGDF